MLNLNHIPPQNDRNPSSDLRCKINELSYVIIIIRIEAYTALNKAHCYAYSCINNNTHLSLRVVRRQREKKHLPKLISTIINTTIAGAANASTTATAIVGCEILIVPAAS